MEAKKNDRKIPAGSIIYKNTYIPENAKILIKNGRECYQVGLETNDDPKRWAAITGKNIFKWIDTGIIFKEAF